MIYVYIYIYTVCCTILHIRYYGTYNMQGRRGAVVAGGRPTHILIIMIIVIISVTTITAK